MAGGHAIRKSTLPVIEELTFYTHLTDKVFEKSDNNMLAVETLRHY